MVDFDTPAASLAGRFCAAGQTKVLADEDITDDGLRQPTLLVDVRGLDAMRGISVTDAITTINDDINAVMPTPPSPRRCRP